MLTDVDEDGFLLVQPEGYGGQKSKVEAFELHHTFGFASRCNDPDVDGDGRAKPGRACTVFYANDGNVTHGFLSHDPRYVEKIPPLKKGGAVMYGGNGGFASFDGSETTWTLYVPFEWDADGVATKAHVVTVGLDGNAKPILELAHGNGQAVTMLDDSLTLAGKGGTTFIEIREDGGTLSGNWKVAGDITDSAGVSFSKHVHPTAMGPSGPPILSPV
ncbi:MAG TPA: hypothetical protein VHO25_07170 [Polyangiaceae bacterium]|nr:hypothetical protein [Polyangiaceae bacterium]